MHWVQAQDIAQSVHQASGQCATGHQQVWLDGVRECPLDRLANLFVGEVCAQILGSRRTLVPQRSLDNTFQPLGLERLI